MAAGSWRGSSSPEDAVLPLALVVPASVVSLVSIDVVEILLVPWCEDDDEEEGVLLSFGLADK